jgi:hypothetical protein
VKTQDMIMTMIGYRVPLTYIAVYELTRRRMKLLCCFTPNASITPSYVVSAVMWSLDHGIGLETEKFRSRS